MFKDLIIPKIINKKPSKIESKEKYKGYVILGIGEGDGSRGKFDKFIGDSYSYVENILDQGGTYLSLEKIVP